MFKGILKEEYSHYVAVLTEEQALQLEGQELTFNWYFYPAILNNQWCISMEEVVGCTNGDFMWVKDLPLIPYIPQPNNIEII